MYPATFKELELDSNSGQLTRKARRKLALDELS